MVDGSIVGKESVFGVHYVDPVSAAETNDFRPINDKIVHQHDFRPVGNRPEEFLESGFRLYLVTIKIPEVSLIILQRKYGRCGKGTRPRKRIWYRFHAGSKRLGVAEFQKPFESVSIEWLCKFHFPWCNWKSSGFGG